MLLARSNLIYLHAPKTGGNSIQTVLLPHSDDQKVLGKGQDGIDRFGIRGAHTSQKHAKLQDYARSLPDLAPYKVAISVRHPFDRAVSFFFTPIRWLREEGGRLVQSEPVWSRTAFLQFLDGVAPLVSFLDVNGTLRKPDFVIRYEAIEEDFAAFTDALGLPDAKLPHVNRSAASAELTRSILADEELRNLVCERYADDMRFFGYSRAG
jgi:Sulfotransferase family